MINTLHSGAANQTEDYGEFDSFWWKFSDYVLQDGTICPAPNAVLTRYDPWSDFNIKGARDQSRFHQRPYLQLIQLAEAPDGEAALAWCRKFGLLGLFFAEAREITLYPRWKKGLPALRRFIRTSSGWICETWSDGTRSDVHLLPADQKPEGALVPKTYWSERFGEPGALLQTIRGELNHVRPGEYMGTFFPTVAESERETYPYPDPLSPEFWRLYSEPVETFLANAHAFANTVARVARIQPLSELSTNERQTLRQARSDMMHLAAQAPLALFPAPDGTYRSESVTTSLIAACAQMALQDIQSGRLGVCDKCGRLFVSTAGRARFCSELCRKATLQREWRLRRTAGEKTPATDTKKQTQPASPAISPSGETE